MSERVEVWKSSVFKCEARLERWKYPDGSLHWHFRDRMGNPYTPRDEEDVNKIKKSWFLEKCEP